jgi:hypothetical protein
LWPAAVASIRNRQRSGGSAAWRNEPARSHFGKGEGAVSHAAERMPGLGDQRRRRIWQAGNAHFDPAIRQARRGGFQPSACSALRLLQASLLNCWLAT